MSAGSASLSPALTAGELTRRRSPSSSVPKVSSSPAGLPRSTNCGSSSRLLPSSSLGSPATPGPFTPPSISVWLSVVVTLSKLTMASPSLPAELSHRMLFASCELIVSSPPPKLKMAPPSSVALLPTNVVLIMSGVSTPSPELWLPMAPPRSAVLFTNNELTISGSLSPSNAAFKIAPPPASVVLSTKTVLTISGLLSPSVSLRLKIAPPAF